MKQTLGLSALAVALTTHPVGADTSPLSVSSTSVGAAAGLVRRGDSDFVDLVAAVELRVELSNRLAFEVEQTVLDPDGADDADTMRVAGFRNTRLAMGARQTWSGVDLSGVLSVILPTAADGVDSNKAGGRTAFSATHRATGSFELGAFVTGGVRDERLIFGLERRDYVDIALAGAVTVYDGRGWRVTAAIDGGYLQTYRESPTLVRHGGLGVSVMHRPIVIGVRGDLSSLPGEPMSGIVSVGYVVGGEQDPRVSSASPLD